jgi:asparaginyl-tRNA synthetase
MRSSIFAHYRFFAHHTGGVGASFSFRGSLVASPAAGQAVEMQASWGDVLGTVDAAAYPLAKKKHSMEYLREIAHLRARTNIGYVF